MLQFEAQPAPPAHRSFVHLLDETPFTPRQAAILRLTAGGLSAKEIALELGESPRVIESQIEKMRIKTGTRNRTHLIAFALKQGLVELPLPEFS